MSAGIRRSVPILYRELDGLEAEDIARMVKSFLREYSLDTARLLSLTGDGASVNGVRRIQTCLSGKNVSALLRRFIDHRMLSIHCAAHRLQLCAGDAFTAEYLKGLDRRIASLYKFIKKHPATRIDLAFWADVTEEPLLSSLSTGKSRWLSLLRPLQKLYASWISVLAHLHFHFKHGSQDRKHQRLLDGVSWGSVAGEQKWPSVVW